MVKFMIKFLGLILIAATSSFIGFYLANNLNKRVIFLEKNLLLIDKIQTFIRYNHTPTNQIINELYNDENLKYLVYIEKCNKTLNKTNDFPKAWKNSIEQSKSELNIDVKDINILKSIGDVLGSVDVEGQLNDFKLKENLIKQNLKEAVSIKNNYSKMYRSLGILCGVGIAIILV